MAEPDPLDLYDFTFRNEVLRGVSNRPHWPEGASGLTLGPGYDIGHRTTAEVEVFLKDELGVSDGPGLAAFVAGAGLSGDAAGDYFAAHRAILDTLAITEDQEKTIFRALVPDYEARVRRVLTARIPPADWNALDDDQKCMLFDYEYNVGLRKFPSFTAAVLAKDWTRARKECVRKGLEGTRRERETFAFLDALGVDGPRLA